MRIEASPHSNSIRTLQRAERADRDSLAAAADNEKR
jgi:hypothetical protein